MLFAKRSLASLALAIPLATGAAFVQAEDGPLAEGQDKFLGGMYSAAEADGFENIFNQVVAENAGKWGVVTNQNSRPAAYQDAWFQATGGNAWAGGLDESFELAKENGYPYRMHVMVWGNQQPSWMANLSQQEQLDAIHEWFDVVSSRYEELGGDRGTFEYVEIVNEPVNDPPDQPDDNGQGGNYIDALGGSGETGWDWVITAFEMGRTYFPNSKLMLNEYNVLSGGVLDQYMEIVDLLVERELIDAVGVQAHAFSTGGSANELRTRLNRVADAGLPVYITEMDIDGPNDQAQLDSYRRVFPVFWEHPDVNGVTLWGTQEGSIWRESAYLIREDGSERPAMQWLRCYMATQRTGIPSVFAGQSLRAGVNLAAGDTVGQVMDCYGADSDADVSWSIVGGTGENQFVIDNQGNLAIAAGQSLVEGENLTVDLMVSNDSGDSEVETVNIEVSGTTVRPPSSDLPTGGGSSSSGSTNALFLLVLALLGGVRWKRRK